MAETAEEVKTEELTPEDIDTVDGVDPVIYDENTETENPPEKVETDIPVRDEEIDDPRFKGKSKKDIYQSYTELEKLKQRHDDEIGTIRKALDAKIIGDLQRDAPAKPKQLTDEEFNNKFLDNPRAVLNHVYMTAKEETKREILQDFGRQSAYQGEMNKLLTEHPDRETVINTPEFNDWVAKNVPSHIFSYASTGFPEQNISPDPAMANLILRAYKKEMSIETVKNEAIKEATTKKGAAKIASSIGSSARGGAEPVFTRMQLAEIMISEPEKYRAMQPQILRAYAEGRVK